MAGSLNKVMLIGNLGADPDIRSTQDGREIANLSIATSESWKDRNTGERRDKTEWHRVVVFSDGLVKVIKNYLRKGSKVFVEGQLQTRKWQDASGQDKYTTEIVLQNFGGTLTMLDGRGDNAGGASSGGSYGGNAGSGGSSASSGGSFGDSSPLGSGSQNQGSAPVLDDEIPF